MRIFWTDGSAEPNPGMGGFAVIEENPDKSGTPVSLGAENPSTNIRMEAMALISAMKLAGDEPVEIHTDSEFWINVMTKWVTGWERNGWKKKSGPIKNLELVQEMWNLYRAGNITLVWVRGHVGTELNELADEWANRARHGETLPDKEGSS